MAASVSLLKGAIASSVAAPSSSRPSINCAGAKSGERATQRVREFSHRVVYDLVLDDEPRAIALRERQPQQRLAAQHCQDAAIAFGFVAHDAHRLGLFGAPGLPQSMHSAFEGFDDCR